MLTDFPIPNNEHPPATPGTGSGLTRRVGGLTARREIPRGARRSFTWLHALG
jgi:hypothetical protein